MCCPPPASRPRGRRLDQGKPRAYRLHWIPRRLKSAHGPRGHAALTNTATASPAGASQRRLRALPACPPSTVARRTPRSRRASSVPWCGSGSHTPWRPSSESTCAHTHVASACIRGSCARYAPTPVMLSMGSFPLHSMLGQFLCHAARKALSLRKALIEQAHRIRGSAEIWLRANGAVRTGSQLPAHWHALQRINVRSAMSSRDGTVVEDNVAWQDCCHWWRAERQAGRVSPLYSTY